MSQIRRKSGAQSSGRTTRCSASKFRPGQQTSRSSARLLKRGTPAEKKEVMRQWMETNGNCAAMEGRLKLTAKMTARSNELEEPLTVRKMREKCISEPPGCTSFGARTAHACLQVKLFVGRRSRRPSSPRLVRRTLSCPQTPSLAATGSPRISQGTVGMSPIWRQVWKAASVLKMLRHAGDGSPAARSWTLCSPLLALRRLLRLQARRVLLASHMRFFLLRRKGTRQAKGEEQAGRGPTGPLGLRVEGLGFKQRMDKLRAALISAQSEDLSQLNSVRRRAQEGNDGASEPAPRHAAGG